MREGLAAPGLHGAGCGLLGNVCVQAHAVVALQNAQSEVLQLGRLMGHYAPVAAHLHVHCT